MVVSVVLDILLVRVFLVVTLRLVRNLLGTFTLPRAALLGVLLVASRILVPPRALVPPRVLVPPRILVASRILLLFGPLKLNDTRLPLNPRYALNIPFVPEAKFAIPPPAPFAANSLARTLLESLIPVIAR